MTQLTSLKMLLLFSCILTSLTNIARAADTNSLTNNAAARSTQFAVAVSWYQADDDQAAKNANTSTPSMSPVLDSYVGVTVGIMFVIGIILLFAKVRRRKPRRSIYRYGRAAARERARAA
jgi:hypothetical protein